LGRQPQKKESVYAELEQMIREAKRRLRSERQRTRQLTLRLPVEVIERAKAEGARQGVPYQTLMRWVLAEGFSQQTTRR
jgi:predicted DNA binding CopG/RHH family protein